MSTILLYGNKWTPILSWIECIFRWTPPLGRIECMFIRKLYTNHILLCGWLHIPFSHYHLRRHLLIIFYDGYDILVILLILDGLYFVYFLCF
jgi:hypothetical protein